MVAYIIPDMPRYIAIQMQREHYLAKQALYNQSAVAAGSTDNEQALAEAGQALADVDQGLATIEILLGDETGNVTPITDRMEMDGNGKAISGSGSMPSLNRSEFRYSPVGSLDSLDEEKLKKKKKPPRRL